MVAAGLAAGVFEQDCKKCSRSDTLRRTWGCDAPTPYPIGFYPCPRCHGIKGDTKCELCGDDHRGVAVTRCPMKLITPLCSEALTLFGWTEKGVLPWPDEGGYAEQPALVMEAISVVAAEVNRLERAKLD